MIWTESPDGEWTAHESGIKYVLIPSGGVFDLSHVKGVAEHLARQRAHGLAQWISGEVRISFRPSDPAAQVDGAGVQIRRTKGGYQQRNVKVTK